MKGVKSKADVYLIFETAKEIDNDANRVEKDLALQPNKSTKKPATYHCADGFFSVLSSPLAAFESI